MTQERRSLSPTPDWLTGIIVVPAGEHETLAASQPQVRCRQCGEILCTIDPGDSLWVLADVSRDHRQWCRDKEEQTP